MESAEAVQPQEMGLDFDIAESTNMRIFSKSATPKEEITMETSISITIDSIQSVIQQVNAVGNLSVFISKEAVARPPFAYFYGFVKFFARKKPSLGWAKLLWDVETQIPQSRKEKLTFLVRLLAVVSEISQYRHDIFVSPSNILCGQDVLSTHRFLNALATSTLAWHDEMAKAVKNALDQGDASLYKKAVRTRAAFRRLQALFRGWQVRKQYNMKSTAHEYNKSSESVQHHGQKSGAIDIESDDHRMCNSPEESSKRTSRSATENLLESYQDILLRKSKVEDELKLAEERLKVESDRLARILNIGSTHKKESRKTSPTLLFSRKRPPFSAPSNSVADRITNELKNDKAPPVDEVFMDKITELSIVERNMKKKVKVIEERERVLKQKMMKTKHKEFELRLHEQRITDIADKIRKQQLQLKEKRLQFEQSKLTDPSTPPSDTSRPCALCSEKEMRLRDVKEKVKHRMRLLNKREAEVIGRAQELRTREIKLLKLQHDIVDSKLAISCADPSSNNDQTEGGGKNRKEGGANNIHGKISKRKRRRNSREGNRKETEPTSNTSVSVEPSLIQSSFGMSVPTIAEESCSSFDEDDNTVETDKYIEHPSLEITDVASETSDRKITEFTSDDECGITGKELRKEIKNKITWRIDPTQKVNLRDVSKSSRNLRSTKSEASSPKRHIFTFEKKGYEETNPRKGNTRSLLSDISDNDTESQHFVRRGGRKKRYDQDDWISSFDAQMKFAKNKLKELL